MGTTSFDLTHMTQWDVSRVETFDKDIFTYLNPRYDVCTERNIRLAAKDGVRWCDFGCSISVSLSLLHTHTHTHTQVRLKPPGNKILCLQLIRRLNVVRDDLHTCPSTLSEWLIKYVHVFFFLPAL